MNGIHTLADIYGTSGDDDLKGGDNIDTFHLEDGGDDTVRGGGGGDVFLMGGSFTADDHIDGGSNGGFSQRYDNIVLDGDYSFGLVLKDRSLSNVEVMTLSNGHDYDITLNAHPTKGSSFTVNGSGLASGHMRIDASAVEVHVVLQGGANADLLIGSLSQYNTFTGSGADTMIGGAANDTFTTDGSIASISAGGGDDSIQINGVLGPSIVDGGAGSDRLTFYGDFSGGAAILDPGHITGIETFRISGGSVTALDGLSAAGDRPLIDASGQGNWLHFDGSADTHDDFTILGGDGDDTLAGGGGSDVIGGGKGDNTLIGGGGDDSLTGSVDQDKLVGGAGLDVMTGGGAPDSFFFLAASDSTADRPDEITDLTNVDTISLKAIDANDKKAGNQAFHLVQDFTHHRGELTLTYDHDADVTVLAGDVNGDGVADFTVDIDGKHQDFTNFVL